MDSDSGHSENSRAERPRLNAEPILVAEDSAIYRNILETSLNQWRFRVTVVKNGLEAWEALQQDNAPRLLIVDWMMPGLDGIELCRRIRGRSWPSRPYVVMLTAHGDNMQIAEGLAAGADAYLIKPFDSDELWTSLLSGTQVLGAQDAAAAQRRDRITNEEPIA